MARTGTPKPASERVPIQRSIQRAVELRRLGLTYKAIAQRMGSTKSTVTTWMAMAREQGLLDDLPAR